jgi:hypothetical protein
MSEEIMFPEKFKKKLPTGFMEEADAMDNDDLKKVIFQSESNIYSIEKDKENDHKLNGAKEIAKELSAPYRDAKSSQTAKIKYALFLLEGRGVSLDNREEEAE